MTTKKRPKKISMVEAYPYPDFDLIKKDSPEYQRLLSAALNYANYVFEPDELKKFTTEYAGFSGTFKGVPIWEFVHVGKVCWLINNGAELQEKTVNDLNARLQNLETTYKNDDAEVKAIIQPVSKSKWTDNLLAELEYFCDRVIYRREPLESFDISKFAQGDLDIPKVKNYFQIQLDQLKDPELKEGFDKWKVSELKRIAELFSFILAQLDKFTPVVKSKKERKISVKKISPSKMVKKMKFLRDFKELELKSIHPEKIVFSKTLWAYNTKTRKLQHYVAATDKGLMVKGSTILNFDEKLSVSKTLRKPKETLDLLLATNKVESRKFMDTIKTTASPLTGRINADTILIKI